VGVPSLSAARSARGGAAQPIGEALEGPGAVGDGPLVFALLDGPSEDATVVYIGVAKRGREAIAEQAAAVGGGVVVCASLPRASRRPQLQAAWKAWVTECGYLPQGNQPPSQPTYPSQPSQLQRTEERGGGEGGVGGAFGGGGGDWQISALAAALAAVTEEAVQTLCDKGFVAGLNPRPLVPFSASREHGTPCGR